MEYWPVLGYRAAMAKGHIERLRSGSYRAVVYAGKDPITGKPRYLKETRPDETEATKALGRLLEQAEAQLVPDQAATLSHLLDRYLEVTDLGLSTRYRHESYIRRVIKPALGDVKIRKLRADTIDALYSHLRRCRKLCGGKPSVDHRTPRPHECDGRCRPHRCTPASSGTILVIHAIISAALGLAIRYQWIDRNPAVFATPPHAPRRDPEPPSPKDTARLLNEAWNDDPEFALFLWLATTTGARRGELCALREHRIDFQTQLLFLARNYIVKNGQRQEKPPKTGEGRRLSLDPLSCELLREHLRQRRQRTAAADVEVPNHAFVFSPDPAGSRPWNPDTMTHRYERLARKLGISSPLKELRHYSATQLLANGIDLRTVAGRLGHSGGGVTTLKYYAQFVRPADQQAAVMLSNQLAELRKKEHLWELFNERPLVELDRLDELAATLGEQVGLGPDTVASHLREFTTERTRSEPTRQEAS